MKFTRVRRRERFQGRVFTLADHDVVLPNGRAVTFHIIEHPGAVAMVPVHDNGDVVLIRQFRVAAAGDLWEIPAGTREAEEAPATTARRELAEETGLRARRWKRLGEVFTAPGFCTEVIVLYLARGLVPTAGSCEPDEVIRPERIPFREALRMIERGRIRDAKTISALHLAARWMPGHE